MLMDERNHNLLVGYPLRLQVQLSGDRVGNAVQRHGRRENVDDG